MGQYAGSGGGGGGIAASGDYQKYFQEYTKQHAGASGGGDYQKYYQEYMKQHAGSGGDGGNSSGGDYQKYYQEYMQQHAGASSGGAYQNYYQKYMAQYSGGDKGSSGSAAGEEPKPTYMAQNAGGSSQAASIAPGMEKAGYPGGGYYQTYMNHYVGGAPTTPPGPRDQQSGGYQQYISQYSGSGEQYMKKHTNASGCGDYLNYYQKYMAQYSGGADGPGHSARSIALAEAAGCNTEKCLKAWRYNQEVVIKSTFPKAYQRCSFVSIEKEYEKNLARVKRSNANTAAATTTTTTTTTTSAGQQYIKQHNNASGCGDFVNYYQKYMAQYNGGADGSSDSSRGIAMAEAAGCSTEKCLKAWRDNQEAVIKSTFPKAYQRCSSVSIEKEYEKNLARVKRSNASTAAATAPAVPTMDLSALIPPIAMAEAAACSTEECLKAWRDKQEVQIKSNVPKDVQHFALDSVEKVYERNLSRIKRASPPEPAALADALAVSPLAMSSDTGHREGSAKTAAVERFRSRSSISIFAFCSLGLLLSITLYSRSRGCKRRRSQQRYADLEKDLRCSAEAWRDASQKGEQFFASDDLENPYEPPYVSLPTE
jgi:hypothetical protein